MHFPNIPFFVEGKMRGKYPADSIIAAIKEGKHLPFNEVKMGHGWVSDELQEEVKTWDCTAPGLKPPVLINAPTGMGKNTFVQNVLAKQAAKQNRYVLLLTNRYTLNLQQKQSIDSSTPPSFGTAMIEGLKVPGKNIICVLYQEVFYCLNSIIEDYGNRIGFVVFDEVHFFCSDATFNVDTCEIFRKLLWPFPRGKRIYMSATPEDVKWLIAYEEYIMYEWFKNSKYIPELSVSDGNINLLSAALAGKGYCITEYTFPRDYSCVNIHFIDTWSKITELISNHDAEEKWLIFVSSKEQGAELKNVLAYSEFIDASYKDMCPNEIRKLARLRKFDQKVLIATTVLYNGFSFEDHALKNIVVDSANRIEVLQMLGRKRISKGESINLFVLKKDLKTIGRFRQSCEEEYEILQEFTYNRNLFNQKRLGTLTGSQQHLFKIHQGYIVGTNPYTPYQLARLSYIYETLEEKFSLEGEAAFFNEVCSWFGVQYNPEMGKSLTEKIAEDVIKLTAEHINQPMSKDEIKNFSKRFIEITDSLITEINRKNKGSIRKDDAHLLTDINKVYKYLGLPYEGKKANSLWTIYKVEDSSKDSEDNVDDTKE